MIKRIMMINEYQISDKENINGWFYTNNSVRAPRIEWNTGLIKNSMLIECSDSTERPTVGWIAVSIARIPWLCVCEWACVVMLLVAMMMFDTSYYISSTIRILCSCKKTCCIMHTHFSNRIFNVEYFSHLFDAQKRLEHCWQRAKWVHAANELIYSNYSAVFVF